MTIMRLTPSERRAALSELESLRRYQQATGHDIRKMIDVSVAERDEIEQWCRDDPQYAEEFRRAVAYRDFILERL
jgi:hypothetical protein